MSDAVSGQLQSHLRKSTVTFGPKVTKVDVGYVTQSLWAMQQQEDAYLKQKYWPRVPTKSVLEKHEVRIC